MKLEQLNDALTAKWNSLKLGNLNLDKLDVARLFLHKQEYFQGESKFVYQINNNNNDILLRTRGPYHRHKSTKSV